MIVSTIFSPISLKGLVDKVAPALEVYQLTTLTRHYSSISLTNTKHNPFQFLAGRLIETDLVIGMASLSLFCLS